MVNVIKRIDYNGFSDKVNREIYFCKKCDPLAKGGNGGIIFDIKGEYDENDPFITKMKEQHAFCSKCGNTINWNHIEIKKNYLK